MRLVVATRNEHKLRELGEILTGFELVPLPPEVELPPEDGDTFAANEESVKTARSAYFPNVSAFAGWSLRKGPTNTFGDSADGWLAGVQSQWAIFDGRATAGRVRQARSLAEQGRLALTEARRPFT